MDTSDFSYEMEKSIDKEVVNLIGSQKDPWNYWCCIRQNSIISSRRPHNSSYRIVAGRCQFYRFESCNEIRFYLPKKTIIVQARSGNDNDLNQKPAKGKMGRFLNVPAH